MVSKVQILKEKKKVLDEKIANSSMQTTLKLSIQAVEDEATGKSSKVLCCKYKPCCSQYETDEYGTVTVLYGKDYAFAYNTGLGRIKPNGWLNMAKFRAGLKEGQFASDYFTMIDNGDNTLPNYYLLGYSILDCETYDAYESFDEEVAHKIGLKDEHIADIKNNLNLLFEIDCALSDVDPEELMNG